MAKNVILVYEKINVRVLNKWSKSGHKLGYSLGVRWGQSVTKAKKISLFFFSRKSCCVCVYIHV